MTKGVRSTAHPFVICTLLFVISTAQPEDLTDLGPRLLGGRRIPKRRLLAAGDYRDDQPALQPREAPEDGTRPGSLGFPARPQPPAGIHQKLRARVDGGDRSKEAAEAGVGHGEQVVADRALGRHALIEEA